MMIGVVSIQRMMLVWAEGHPPVPTSARTQHCSRTTTSGEEQPLLRMSRGNPISYASLF
jgi:hypothetical protein